MGGERGKEGGEEKENERVSIAISFQSGSAT